MHKIFIATSKDTSGFFIWNTGNSNYTGEDYYVITNNMIADEIPKLCLDAADSAYLIAGLLNAYYNDIDVSMWDHIEVARLGLPDNKAPPSKEDKSLPF